MRLARAEGKAPRELSGWVPTTTYHYDESGRLTHSTVDSPWNQNQREMMFALEDAEADKCPGCGGFLSFTTRRDHGHEISRRQCEQCAAIAAANKEYDKEDERLKGSLEEWEPSARRVSARAIPLPPEALEEIRALGVSLDPREG